MGAASRRDANAFESGAFWLTQIAFETELMRYDAGPAQRPAILVSRAK